MLKLIIQKNMFIHSVLKKMQIILKMKDPKILQKEKKLMTQLISKNRMILIKQIMKKKQKK